MPRMGLAKQVTGALATAPVQLCEASPTRWKLAISIDVGIGYVSTSPGTAAGVGYNVTPSAPLIMDYEDWGEIVRAAWYGSADNAGRKFGVIDVSGGP